jgi:hypothetical protein
MPATLQHRSTVSEIDNVSQNSGISRKRESTWAFALIADCTSYILQYFELSVISGIQHIDSAISGGCAKSGVCCVGTDTSTVVVTVGDGRVSSTA